MVNPLAVLVNALVGAVEAAFQPQHQSYHQAGKGKDYSQQADAYAKDANQFRGHIRQHFRLPILGFAGFMAVRLSLLAAAV